MDTYSITAPHYDAAYGEKRTDDLPFYLSVADEKGGPVLDVGCGTGRMSLPLAGKGTTVTAIDASKPMLTVFRRKLADAPEDVRSRITIQRADMRNLVLDTRFPLVIVPFRALQHLHSVEDQIRAFTALRNCLAPGGWLAFDVFLPNLKLLASGIGQEIEELSWVSIEAGQEVLVRRVFVKDTVDPLSLTFSGRFIYRTFRGTLLLREESEPLSMNCYTYHHLMLLFRLAGLERLEEFGTFARTPLTGDSPEMIFICGKAD